MFVSKNEASVGEVRGGGTLGRDAKPWAGKKSRCPVATEHVLSIWWAGPQRKSSCCVCS